MPSLNFVKNITSKDTELAHKTLKELISSGSSELFGELCEKSEFIFPFLKERISQDFVKLLNKEDLKTVFEFSKIWSEDFHDIIVKSWLKFANEDLTDEILELFNTGTNEQKTYAAIYFSHIRDPLALEYLNKYSKSDFSPLKTRCAAALAAFGDETALKEAMNEIFETDDEFEKFGLYEFICAYKSDKALKFVLDNCFECDFYENIILNLLDNLDFEYLKARVEKDVLLRIFKVVLEAYPENLSLDTLGYYQIFDWLKHLSKNNDSYSKNLLLKAKKDFALYNDNDIYTYDLDKNSKNELRGIVKFLNGINITPEIEKELNPEFPHRYTLALEIIKEYNLKNVSNELIELINNKRLSENLLAQSILTLKALGSENLIDKSVVNSVENENIKAIILNCFN